jgi:hypothetical protein
MVVIDRLYDFSNHAHKSNQVNMEELLHNTDMLSQPKEAVNLIPNFQHINQFFFILIFNIFNSLEKNSCNQIQFFNNQHDHIPTILNLKNLFDKGLTQVRSIIQIQLTIFAQNLKNLKNNFNHS